MVYDLAALEQDSTMSNNRKFNTMKDHVTTLRNEVAYFSSIIFSAQRSRSDIQDIVRSYTETLKGLWNRINKEIQDAENIMVQVLRSAKFDGGNQHSIGTPLTAAEVKAAHKQQVQLITELYSLIERVDPDVLLKNNAEVTTQVNALITRHKTFLQDRNMGRCFSRIVPGCEMEFNYNQDLFQDMAADVLESLRKFCVLYDDLDLPTLKDRLLKLNTVEGETAIQNLIINRLEQDAGFIDEAVYKRALKATEKPNPRVFDKLQVIGQNYFEYNQMEIRIARFVMGLIKSKDEKQKNEMFAKMHHEVKMRVDNFYKDVNRILMEALRQTYTPMAQTYSQMGMTPPPQNHHFGQGHAPVQTTSQPFGGSQLPGPAQPANQGSTFGGANQPYGTQSQPGGNPGQPVYQSQFNGQGRDPQGSNHGGNQPQVNTTSLPYAGPSQPSGGQSQPYGSHNASDRYSGQPVYQSQLNGQGRDPQGSNHGGNQPQVNTTSQPYGGQSQPIGGQSQPYGSQLQSGGFSGQPYYDSQLNGQIRDPQGSGHSGLKPQGNSTSQPYRGPSQPYGTQSQFGTDPNQPYYQSQFNGQGQAPQGPSHTTSVPNPSRPPMPKP